MKKETVFVKMDDGKNIALHTWVPAGGVRAVVQVSHGMAEYALRYDAFAEFLVSKGIAVYAHDHRGHGESAHCIDDLGFIAKKDGFFRVCDDLHAMVLRCKKDFPSVPVILFGHSFGSFVSQYFIEHHGSEIQACILCGTAGPSSAVKAGKAVASLVCALRGARYRSSFLDKASFGTYNNRIENNKTEFDWLSRDENEVKKYIGSQYCGFLCTASFFRDITTGLSFIHKPENMEKVPVELPVYFIAGDADPVGAYTKTIDELIAIYKKNGVKKVSHTFYKGARHELLNETNKGEIYKDILSFIERVLS